jgi:hypothetical protein
MVRPSIRPRPDTVPPSNLARLRRICLAFPEATEVEAWSSSTFRCKKVFAMHASPNDHHGDGREGVWVKTDSFTQDLLLHSKPKQYFKPPYVGPFGWTGVYLNARTNWTALTDLLCDAYCLAAPKKLAARMKEVAVPPKKRPVRRKTKR